MKFNSNDQHNYVQSFLSSLRYWVTKMYPNKLLMESWRFSIEKNFFFLGKVEIKVFKVEHLGNYFQKDYFQYQKAEENKFLV